MARNPNLTQDKLDLLAQIPPEVISSGVKTQADLAAMIHGLKSRIIESVLAGEMEHHLSTSHDYGSLDSLTTCNRRNGYSNIPYTNLLNELF